MSIIQILSDKKTSDAEKLGSVAEIVAKVREAYDNTDSEVASVDVNTTYGATDFADLQDDSKVSILLNEANVIRAKAVEFGRNCEGANVNKELERLIATSAVFCNIVSKSDMSYI